eukprot:4356596-Alexandrium_andersonii.AAC.1
MADATGEAGPRGPRPRRERARHRRAAQGCREEDAGRLRARVAGPEERRAVPARALLHQHAADRRQ